MFRRRREKSPSQEPSSQPTDSEILMDLRGQVLRLDPAELRLEPGEHLPRVFGLVMEEGYPEGWATLVVLAEGSTSLYTSSGFGIIGGGEHEQVAAASLELLRAAEARFDAIGTAWHEDLPASGDVALRVLAFEGPRLTVAREDDLADGRHDLSPLFYLAHDVITQLRLIDEA